MIFTPGLGCDVVRVAELKAMRSAAFVATCEISTTWSVARNRNGRVSNSKSVLHELIEEKRHVVTRDLLVEGGLVPLRSTAVYDATE